jgi:membrane protein
LRDDAPERLVSLKGIVGLWKAAFVGWYNDNVPRMGASLSYYTLFSFAPILVIVIAIAGAVFGEQAVRGQIAQQLGGLVGETGAKAIQDLIRNAHQPKLGTIASVIGGVTFLLGATGAFLELEAALDDIWKVKAKTANKGFVGMVLQRILSFGLVVAVGFLLLASLVVSAGLAAAQKYMTGIFPLTPVIWQIVNVVVSVAVITVLFALVYKVLPNVQLEWADVWIGSVESALIVEFGKVAIGIYLGHSSVASSYGAAGSIVVLLAWIYYTSQVVLLGAEFTKAYAAWRGTR